MRKAVSTQTDEQLMPLVIAGDIEAFETVYERRQGRIYRFALRMSGSESVAEDVTQEVFMALMRDAGLYDPSRGTVSAYLYGMARHRVLKRLERDRSFVSISEEGEDDEAVISDRFIVRDDPLVEMTRTETIEAVRQAILALPGHYREVVVLCDLQEMNYDEAAVVLGCPVGTVRSRLHRARGMLVKRLRGAGPKGLTAEALINTRCQR